RIGFFLRSHDAHIERRFSSAGNTSRCILYPSTINVWCVLKNERTVVKSGIGRERNAHDKGRDSRTRLRHLSLHQFFAHPSIYGQFEHFFSAVDDPCSSRAKRRTVYLGRFMARTEPRPSHEVAFE